MPDEWLATDAANEQHYEVSAAFYRLALGPRLKYSSGFWPKRNTTFEESEVAMMEIYCERARLRDGMKVSPVLYVVFRAPQERSFLLRRELALLLTSRAPPYLGGLPYPRL